jgi:tripartite-type tricarboxylate transporter receptor subunit TctC
MRRIVRRIEPLSAALTVSLAHLKRLLLAATLAASAIAPSAAQVYPSRPITMVVPFPAGGGADIVGRILAEHMRTSLGQPVAVENISGASGSIGTGRVARAAPDGYTLVLGNWASHVANGAVYNLQYDLRKDFEPVALVGHNPLWIVTRTTLPAKDLKDLIAWLKANRGKASAATVGVGSGAHLCGIYFQNSTGARFQFVPYRGGAPAMQDMIGGRVDLMCDNASNSLPQARSGNIKAMAVLSKTRWSAAPDVPTADEAGLPGLHVPFWHWLWAPKATPKEVVGALNSAVVKALTDATVRQRIAAMGLEIPPRDQLTPEALRAIHLSEIEKWWPIIKAANIWEE